MADRAGEGTAADLGVPIACGRTAEIYAWPGGQVLKLFHDWFGQEEVKYEARIARAVHAGGLPVPAVGDLIRVNGRTGLVYQRLDGGTMMAMMARRPWRIAGYARRMAELHAGMHAVTDQAGLPPQRRRLTEKIGRAKGLPSTVRDKALAALRSLPDGDRICHGDLHPGNVLMTPRGPVVIDWIDATCGNPLADLARTTILALGAIEAGQIKGFLKRAFLQIFHGAYLHYYFKIRPGGEGEYRRWLPVVAAARLSENITELQGWLVAQAEKGLPS